MPSCRGGRVPVHSARSESSTVEALVLRMHGGSTAWRRCGDLPDAFRYSEAAKRIGESNLRSLVAAGRVTRVSRGPYRKTDVLADDDLIDIATRARRATLCLRTALVHHDLIDDIPPALDVAILRGA